MTYRQNTTTPAGQELGEFLARFYEHALAERPDTRCATCAFRQGDHLANGSPETLMSALKCVLEGEPFWCHEQEQVCAGWAVVRVPKERRVQVPWDYAQGVNVLP